jgi:hypothetical protein
MWLTALGLVGLCLSFGPVVLQRVHAASYVETAVAVHRSYLEGNLVPEIQSDSPAFVTAWFADKVPFDFRLPAARAGNAVYRLAGARLVSSEATMRRWSSTKRKERRSEDQSYRCLNQVRRYSWWR